MNLDFVHDLQSVYRKMVDSTSRPGYLSDLSREVCLVETAEGCSASILLIALTLFDQEVTFKVIPPQAEVVSKTINQFTYAKPADIEEADYLIVLQDAEEGSLTEAIEKAKPGELNNPHKSAMIIVESESITSGETLLLNGPGIQGTNSIQVKAEENWMDCRRKKNMEYPLGIDLIFVDSSHQLLALPRTTQITGNRVIV